MTVSSVTSNPFAGILANSATSTASTVMSGSSTLSSSASPDLQSTFLQLLVAQMNNQDPLNPTDSTQMTSELAQISTVTGINNLNTSVTSLLSELQQSASIQSAQLTGHSVMVAGTSLPLAANTSSSTGVSAVGGYSLGGAASNVAVTVKDSTGATVRTLQLGAQAAGFQDFTWNGQTDSGTTAAAGTYSFSVSATSSTGASVSATTYNAQAVIGSVPQSDGSTQLMLGNGNQVPMSAVEQII
jgi:flagellar basal-body rod modification protein FlgD